MRELLITYGRLLHDKGYAKEAEGNLSIRAPGGFSIYITPTGFDKGELKLSSVVEVGLHGKRSGGYLDPSSDLEIHLGIYRLCPSVKAVLHTHSPRAVRLAQEGASLPGLPCVDGEEAIPKAVQTSGAALLKGHAVYIAGKDLEACFKKLEEIERS